MFLEGGPAAPVAPAAPAAPAPAAPTPAPAPVPPAAPAPAPQPTPPPAQRSLADAQLTGPVVMPTEPPAAPAAPAAPPVPPQVSPDALAQAEQRVKDAQRKMHQTTAEAAALRNQLNSILNHPQLGPLIAQATATPPAGAPVDPVAEAWRAYQAAPNDEAAFRHLLATAKEQARSAVMSELENKRIQEVNTQRAQQRDMLVAQAINKEVAEKAPDVPLELFWAMSTKAELETPPTLVTIADKLQWQIERAVEMARQVLESRTSAAVTAAQQSREVRGTAAVVMPAGSTVSPGGGGQSTQPMTFVEQLRAAQARKVGKI